MGAFVGLAGKALKAVLKIALFCGLAWFLIPFGVWLATELITGKYLEQVPVMNTVCNILWYMCYGFAPLTLIQNIIRVIKKDQSFSWIRLIMNRKEQKGFEAKLGGDAVALKTAKDLSGVVFGKQGGKYATMPETTDGHVLIVGGAGSGKTAAVGMMCNQFLKSFERRAEGNTTPILFLIDEFPRLGKIEAISNGLATLRSKKIHISLIVQSKSQLNAIYGKDVAEVIADNCSYKAILKASEPTTQEWCSKLVGTYDKKKVSSNYNADIMGVGKGQGTSSSTEEKRIIKPEEFAYLQDVVCVFPNGYKRLQKANYYEDSTFTSKM